MSAQHHFKLFFEGKDSIRRCSFSKTLPSFTQFLATCQELFRDEFIGEHYRFMYLDNEGDWISVSSEVEWTEMLDLSQQTKGQPIKLHVKKVAGAAQRSSVKLGESLIDADVSIEELEKLAVSLRPNTAGSMSTAPVALSAASKKFVSAPVLSSPQINTHPKAKDDDPVRQVLAESAEIFEQEQDKLLQRVIQESKKTADMVLDIAKSITQSVTESSDSVNSVVAQGNEQRRLSEEKRVRQEAENAEREKARVQEQLRLSTKASEDAEKKKLRIIEEEEKQKRALQLLKSQHEENERRKKEEENLARAKALVANMLKEKEIQEKRRAEELKRKEEAETEEKLRKQRELEETKRKQKEQKEREEFESKRSLQEENELRRQAQLVSDLEGGIQKRALKFNEEIFQLRSLGFEHDIAILVPLLEASGGDIIPVVDQLLRNGFFRFLRWLLSSSGGYTCVLKTLIRQQKNTGIQEKTTFATLLPVIAFDIVSEILHFSSSASTYDRMASNQALSSPIKELGIAVAYWKNLLATSKVASLPSDALSAFEKTLLQHLGERVRGHWFPENPIRGQAHRSISLHRHARPDPMLLKAAAAAKIRNLFNFFTEDVTEITMFVDPGEVAVQSLYTFCKTPQETVVWSSPNKLNKIKPNMEPSAPLMIRSSTDIVNSSSSSLHSTPTHSPMRRDSVDREDSPRARPALKASSREYSPSPERQHSPPPMMYSRSAVAQPLYVPMHQPYFSYPAYSNVFDGKMIMPEFVRS